MGNSHLLPYERFQLEKYGNILTSTNEVIPAAEVYENGVEEADKFSSWSDQQAEFQLLQKEEDL